MEAEIAHAGKEVRLVISALLPIVNPLESAPIFLAMTASAFTCSGTAPAFC
jgi:small neutral amino acid transporter SnatA (MarC family)